MQLRYVRRRYATPETARQIAIEIANATFAARSTELWGQGSTAVASDSTHVRAYDQNLFIEWHSRYGGRGVLIYWHTDGHGQSEIGVGITRLLNIDLLPRIRAVLGPEVTVPPARLLPFQGPPTERRRTRG